MDSKAIFSANLLYYIRISGKTQKEIAETLNISRSSLNNWIKGSKYPRIEKIEQLADYFCISTTDLIEKKELPDDDNSDLSITKLKLISLVVQCTDDVAEKLLKMAKLFLDK